MEEIVIKVDLKKLKKLIKQAEEQADQLQKTLDEINEIRNLISQLPILNQQQTSYLPRIQSLYWS